MKGGGGLEWTGKWGDRMRVTGGTRGRGRKGGRGRPVLLWQTG